MEFQKGSIVKRRLDGLTEMFAFHTGIYIGENMIIHFNGEKKGDRNSVIQKATLEEYANEKKVKLSKSPHSEEHGEKVNQKALELFEDSENSFNNKYSYIFNNCESFTKCCFETEYESVEIRKGKAPFSQVIKHCGLVVVSIVGIGVALLKGSKNGQGES